MGTYLVSPERFAFVQMNQRRKTEIMVMEDIGLGHVDSVRVVSTKSFRDEEGYQDRSTTPMQLIQLPRLSESELFFFF